eukprot:1053532-Pleurochrysis_carterae.AAC.7
MAPYIVERSIDANLLDAACLSKYLGPAVRSDATLCISSCSYESQFSRALAAISRKVKLFTRKCRTAGVSLSDAEAACSQ